MKCARSRASKVPKLIKYARKSAHLMAIQQNWRVIEYVHAHTEEMQIAAAQQDTRAMKIIDGLPIKKLLRF